MSIEDILEAYTKDQLVEAAGYKGRGLTERDYERLIGKLDLIRDLFKKLGYDVVLRETQTQNENEKWNSFLKRIAQTTPGRRERPNSLLPFARKRAWNTANLPDRQQQPPDLIRIRGEWAKGVLTTYAGLPAKTSDNLKQWK